MGKKIIEMKNVSKEFLLGKGNIVRVIDNLSLNIEEGEFVVIIGRSDSGKSTLMHMMSGLTFPTIGEIFVKEQKINHFTPRQMANFRNREMGFVFQNFFLDKSMNALENVMLPLMLTEKKYTVREKTAKEIMKQIGLEHVYKNKIHQLSGGEMQRVCIARALVCNPNIIFADEPTGNLDKSNGRQIIDLLRNLRKNGKTIIMVTHNENDIQSGDRVIELEDGNIVRNEEVL